MCKWQSMKSAPKDGSIIILYREPVDFGEHHSLVVGAYDKQYEKWVWPDRIFNEYDHERFWEIIEEGELFAASSNSFQAWRPLLTPPSKVELAAQEAA